MRPGGGERGGVGGRSGWRRRRRERGLRRGGSGWGGSWGRRGGAGGAAAGHGRTRRPRQPRAGAAGLGRCLAPGALPVWGAPPGAGALGRLDGSTVPCPSPLSKCLRPGSGAGEAGACRRLLSGQARLPWRLVRAWEELGLPGSLHSTAVRARCCCHGALGPR